jgi:hypothetical protein
MMVSKVVFVSSTVYDLERERAFLKSLLEHRRRPVTFSTILSEEPSFPITPVDLATKHSYQICLDKIASADYFIALIKNRYGSQNVEDNGELISITHREYREAYRRRLPIFALVDRRTWNARKRHKEGRSQGFVPAKHLHVFDFIDEISKLQRNNWMYFYRNRVDMKLALEQVLFNFDDATFIADVTIPDGSIIHTDEPFEKVWAIKNTGCVAWKNRYLREENSGASGLVASTPRIAIPRTAPGETARLAVKFSAPKYPCTCESYWKMVDSKDRHLFPKKKGIYCRVKVIY